MPRRDVCLGPFFEFLGLFSRSSQRTPRAVSQIRPLAAAPSVDGSREEKEIRKIAIHCFVEHQAQLHVNGGEVEPLIISDLALWLPREGLKLDKKLGFFILRFARLVCPKDKRSVCRASYRRQISLFSGNFINVNPNGNYKNDDLTIVSSTTANEIAKNKYLMNIVGKSDEDDDTIFYKTKIFLYGGNDATSLSEHRVTLPMVGRVDQHLMRNFFIEKARRSILSKPVQHFSRDSNERVLYIHQGEVGHAVSNQADVIISDKTTTCHVMAFRSESPKNCPLTSLAHIDCDRYDDCVRSMIEAHIAHHYQTSKGKGREGEKPSDSKKMNLQVHVVGGFEDDRYSSAKISAWLMDTLAWNATLYKGILKMTLQTCVISCMNDTTDDNGISSPIGRGMGIDLFTGEVFLATADREVAGPAQQLRSARIWSGGDGALNLVHNSKSNNFVCKAFKYEAIPNMNELLRLSDHKMIRRTSTSPEVEESDFCVATRNTLRFLQEVDCTCVFGANADEPLVFERVGTSNVWRPAPQS